MRKNEQEAILSEIFNAAGRYIIEGGELPRFVGDEDQVRVIRRATLASRRFYEALCSDSSTMDTISVMMEERRRASDDFRKSLGRDWRF